MYKCRPLFIKYSHSQNTIVRAHTKGADTEYSCHFKVYLANIILPVVLSLNTVPCQHPSPKRTLTIPALARCKSQERFINLTQIHNLHEFLVESIVCVA